jgi:hypothetical protein
MLRYAVLLQYKSSDSFTSVNHPAVLANVIALANVSTLSLLALNTGIRVPFLFVHQVTCTLLPEAEISVFWSIVFPLLGALIIIVFRVFPSSVLFAKNTLKCPVSLLAQAIYA